MKKSVLNTFRSKYFLIPTISLTLILAGLLSYYLSIEDKVIFPASDNFACNYYTDDTDGGQSAIRRFAVSDSLLQLDFELREGFVSPYVGLSISPKNKPFIDASAYNQIKLQLSGSGINRIGVSIYTPLDETRKHSEQDESLFHSYLNISAQIEAYTIPIKQLAQPDWWKDLHQLPGAANEQPDLSRILHLNINSAFVAELAGIKNLSVHSISFTRDNSRLFSFLAIVYLMFVGLLFAILVRPKPTSPPLTVSYQPVEANLEKEGNQKAIDFINQNFQRSELNLELVTRETGISQRRITQAIHDNYQCNFKTYINRIRISEAQRLLTNSDLNIGEIAFRVGFNSQSHFNRVFKSELNTSPSAYRNTH